MLDAQIPCTGIRPAQVGIDRCDRARSVIRCGAERRIAAYGSAAREHGTGNTPIHARCELNGSSRDIAATWNAVQQRPWELNLDHRPTHLVETRTRYNR